MGGIVFRRRLQRHASRNFQTSFCHSRPRISSTLCVLLGGRVIRILWPPAKASNFSHPCPFSPCAPFDQKHHPLPNSTPTTTTNTNAHCSMPRSRLLQRGSDIHSVDGQLSSRTVAVRSTRAHFQKLYSIRCAIAPRKRRRVMPADPRSPCDRHQNGLKTTYLSCAKLSNNTPNVEHFPW